MFNSSSTSQWKERGDEATSCCFNGSQCRWHTCAMCCLSIAVSSCIGYVAVVATIVVCVCQLSLLLLSIEWEELHIGVFFDRVWSLLSVSLKSLGFYLFIFSVMAWLIFKALIGFQSLWNHQAKWELPQPCASPNLMHHAPLDPKQGSWRCLMLDLFSLQVLVPRCDSFDRFVEAMFLVLDPFWPMQEFLQN